jgi:hypothetical protein
LRIKSGISRQLSLRSKHSSGPSVSFRFDIVPLAHNVSFWFQKPTYSVSFWAQKPTHYVSFWIQKTLHWANFCSNRFFLFLLNSSIIQSMFKLFFSFSIAQNSWKQYWARNCVSFWAQKLTHNISLWAQKWRWSI